jgi:hypothetical protein
VWAACAIVCTSVGHMWGRCGMLSGPLTPANYARVSRHTAQNMGSDMYPTPTSSVVSPQGREP